MNRSDTSERVCLCLCVIHGTVLVQRISMLDSSDLASELLSPYNAGADGLILWGDDPEDPKYWAFVANTTGPSIFYHCVYLGLLILCVCIDMVV
jgi:hypothetical protein